MLAALDHTHGVVLGQADVDAKTNEIPVFTSLLDRIAIGGAVITADALHAQRGHATYLAGRGATTCSRSSATSPAYSPSSPPCPGGRCPLPATLASAATAGPSGAP